MNKSTGRGGQGLDRFDEDALVRAVYAKDARFDGQFTVGVVSTGIYCRPSCPAAPPKRKNLRFFRTPAAAQLAGLRACKRCRPDASPGSPEWSVHHDVVGRTMRLIADGVVDRDGVVALADRLGYSERHLNRILTEQLGAGPLAIARARRAQNARILIERTDLPLTDVAFAAGFGSVRQFNDTIREVFATSPSELRGRRRVTHARSAGAGAARGRALSHDDGGHADDSVAARPVALRLAVRRPFASAQLFDYLGRRIVAGVEEFDGRSYRRTLSLPHGHAIVQLDTAVDADATGVTAAVVVEDWRDLAPAVERCRRLLDLDADPVAVDTVLGADELLAPLVAARPGLRSPGAVDGFEIAVRAIVGQQISVSGARTVLGRMVAALAEPLAPRLHAFAGSLTHVFVTPDRLAAVDPASLPMPAARAATIADVAAAVAAHELTIDAGTDPRELFDALVRRRGIGPWTANYVAMRALSDPDVFLDTDLGVRHALEGLGAPGDPRSAAALAVRFSPWRSYALHHLWASLPTITKGP